MGTRKWVGFEGIEPKAKESCARGRCGEKYLSSEARLPFESVSVDQGWQKRGTAINSRSGHFSMIGGCLKNI